MNASPVEKGMDRGGWLVLAFVLAFVLTTVAVTIIILRMPGDGWQIPYGEFDTGNFVLVNYVGDWDTPMEEGDVVTAIDGQRLPVSAILAPLTSPKNWVENGTVIYTIMRDGVTIDVPVKLQVMDWRSILRSLAYTVIVDLPQWSWIVAGVVIFLLKPRNKAARLLMIAGTSIAVVTKIGWAATTLSLNYAPLPIWSVYLVLTFFWGWLFYPSLILLLLSFPIPQWPLTRYPRLTLWLIYGTPLVLASFTMLLQEVWPAAVVLVSEAVLIFATAVGAVIQVFRQKHNRVARAQVSWVALGIAVSIGGTLLVYLVQFFDLTLDFGNVLDTIIAWPVAFALPVSLSIAILRFRLFDIDIIIRRTLQYAILTAILALVYFGGVVLLQNIFDALAGQSDSPLITVVSTLAIAALFNPLRLRIQDFIDRRFFRQKYDAEQTLARFAAASRDEVDLENLTHAMLGAVKETLQPDRASLWLKE